jgi:hypothetical protein
MPKDLDEIEEMEAESSTAPALDEADGAQAPEASAEPSAATEDETPTDTLSIVRDVVDGKETSEEPAPSAEGEEGAEEGADGTEPPAEQDDEDFSDVPFNKHPRFQHVIRELKRERVDGQRYRNVSAFLEANNLTDKEAADIMAIAGLAKTNPVKAWADVKDWVGSLLVAAGEILPKDLAERVGKNELTRDAALELSRNRAALAARDAVDKFQQQRRERQQATEQGQTLRDTADDWLARRAIKDPNFATKEARLGEKVAFLQRTEGVPNTPDGVKAQLNKAYAAVNRELGIKPAPSAAPAAPAPAARRPAITPVRGGQVSADARPAAPSGGRRTVDVIKDVLSQKRA